MTTTFALVCLSLFTDVDRAAEIEGDLLEQVKRRGKFWFWWQVKLTCLALFFYGLRQERGRLLLISYALYELALKLDWWVLWSVRVALWRGLDLTRGQLPVMENCLHTFVAFSLAMLVVRLSPKYGGPSILLAGGFLLGRVVLLAENDPTHSVIRFLVFILLPAIVGTLLMKWMELRHGFQASQRNSRSGTL